MGRLTNYYFICVSSLNILWIYIYEIYIKLDGELFTHDEYASISCFMYKTIKEEL